MIPDGLSCALKEEERQQPENFGPLFLQAALAGGAAGATGGMFHLATDNVSDLRHALVTASGHFAWVVSILVSAALAILAVLAVRRFAPETAGSGIQEIEGALAGKRPFRYLRVLLVKFPAGVLSLCSGLVLGREGPTIQIGGATGRVFAIMSACPAPYTRHCLVAAGAGAGLTAAFNAPLAGILFVVEEMREQFQFDFVSFHCLVIACAAATVVSRLVAGSAQAIPMPVLPSPEWKTLALFLVFGITVGLAGVVFNAALTRTMDIFETFSRRISILAVLIVGGLIGLCAWGLPEVTGGGHTALLAALSQPQPVDLLIAFFVLRFGLTVLSYSTGAPGGIFSPMLALGTLWGILYGILVQDFLPGAAPQPMVFAVAGMGAFFAATVRAPMTGMILIMEMTGNYSLTLPLMVTCMASAATAEMLGGKSIYRTLLQRLLAREHGEA